MQSQEYSSPIGLPTCASSTTRWPSTVQRTAPRRSFQTKYLMRSAFNFSFVPGVLIDPSGLNRQINSAKCCMLLQLIPYYLPPEPPSISHLRVSYGNGVLTCPGSSPPPVT